MEITESQLSNATSLYLDLKKKYYEAGTEENLNAMYGAGRVLSMLDIDIDNLDKRYCCPVCGWRYGKSFVHSGCDPECAKCGWQGKY